MLLNTPLSSQSTKIDLEKLTPVFEIYVAINSAYIISNHFTQALISNIFGVLQEIQGVHLSRAKGVLESNKSYLDTLLEGERSNDSIEVVRSLSEKHAQHESEFETLTSNAERIISQSGVSKTFNFYCLFSALFSLVILLCVGFDCDFHHFNDDGFLVFILSSPLFFIFFIKRGGVLRYNIFSSGYTASIGAILISIFLFWIYSGIQMLIGVECPENFFLLNRILAVVIPVIHFVYYFYKSYKNKRKIYPKMKEEITYFISEVEKFGIEVKVSLDMIKRLDRPTSDNSDV